MGINRREFLAGTCAAGAAALLPGEHTHAAPASVADADFTFVHLTDMHVARRRKGNIGYQRCIESVQALRPRPAFSLMGGDLAFDGCYNERDEFEDQIRLYKEVSDSMGIPYYNCLGNHDVLGWSARRKVPVTDPELGKKMIMDRLEWEKPYYSFDHAGWHFVVLDSIFPIQADHGPTYEPRIGEEQLEWLAYDLGAAGDRPKVAVTHIAAFCNMGQINGDPNRKAMDGHMVLWDTKELRTIFERHKLTALLQGHSHRPEAFCYNNVWYLTSPAVSGAWWSGSWNGAEPGYTIFRCKGKELTWEQASFAWEPHLEPGDTVERERTEQMRQFKAEQRRLLEMERRGRKS